MAITTASEESLETKSEAPSDPAPAPSTSTSIGTETETETKTHEDKNQEGLEQSIVSRDKEEEDDEEEDAECGFCLFMKAGGCRDSFIAWENCVEDAEKNKEDIVEKCSEVTGLLKKCMDAHPDYYEPILRAEKAMEEEATKELEREFEPLEYHEN